MIFFNVSVQDDLVSLAGTTWVSKIGNTMGDFYITTFISLSLAVAGCGPSAEYFDDAAEQLTQPTLVADRLDKEQDNLAILSDDSRFVLTVDGARTVRLFERSTGKQVRRFKMAGNHAIWNASLSSDLSHLAVFRRGTVELWNPATQKLSAVADFQNRDILGGSIFAQTSEIVAVGSDGTIWRWKYGEKTSPTEVARFSGDWRYIAAADHRPLVLLGGGSGALLDESASFALLVDYSTGREVMRFPGIQQGAISRSGNFLLLCDKNTVQLWQVAGSHCVCVASKKLSDFGFGVNPALALVDDRHCLFNNSSGWWLWDAREDRILRHYGDYAPSHQATLSADGHYLLLPLVHGHATLWNADSGEVIREYVGEQDFIFSAATATKPNRIITSGRSGTVRLFNYENSSLAAEFIGRGAVVSTDGRYMATCDDPGNQQEIAAARLKVQSSSTQRDLAEFKLKLNSNAASTKELTARAEEALKTLKQAITDYWSVASGRHPNDVLLWNAVDGTLLHRLRGREIISLDPETYYLNGHIAPVTALAFSPDGRSLATGDQYGVVRFWDVASGKEFKHLETQYGLVGRLTFSKETIGRRLLVDDQIGSQFYDLTNDQALIDAPTSFYFQPISSVLSESGRFVVMGARTIGIYDGKTGNRLSVLDGQFSNPAIPAFSKSEEFLATGGDGSRIRIWSVPKGNLLKEFNGVDLAVRVVAFSPDASYLYACGENGHSGFGGSSFARGRLQVWDWRNSKLIGELTGEFPPDPTLSFTDGGKHLWANLADGTLGVWRTGDTKPLAQIEWLGNQNWAVIAPDGRFEANNLDNVKGFHWVFQDEPFRAISAEVFMRDYYEPRLLPRLLNPRPDEFKQVRSLSQANRAQPEIRSIQVRPGKEPRIAEVLVDIQPAEGTIVRGGKRQSVATVHDLRLFRNGQLIRQEPELPQSNPIPLGITDAELSAWDDATQLKASDKVIINSATGRITVRFDGVRLPQLHADKVQFSAYVFNADRIKSATATTKQ